MKLQTIFVSVFVLPVVVSQMLAAEGLSAGSSTDSLRIVVLGSSTAEGVGPTNPSNAWVNRYRTFLQSSNPNFQVINLASGGYTTFHIMPTGFIPPGSSISPDPNRNITKALSLNPSAIIINLPSNDAAFGFSVDEQLANYDSILAVAAIQNVPVWITTTQPRNLSATGRKNLMDMRDSTTVRFGNKAIDFWSGLALENGKIDPRFDSGDGIHLNDTGHQILFERVLVASVGLSRFEMQLLWPQADAEVSGVINIIWSPEIKSDASRMTTIEVSRDAGSIWERVRTIATNDTLIFWDTSNHPDGTRYMVRVVALGDSGLAIAQSQGTFTVNNPGNAVPEVEILAPSLDDTLAGEIEVRWHAADADGDPLNIFLDFSIDRAIWQSVATGEPNDGLFLWDTDLLPNSTLYHLKLRCTDGTEWVEEVSGPFAIQNRSQVLPSSNLHHVLGSGDGWISARIVDPMGLTGHHYRITFDDTTLEMTTYDVTDLETGLLVVDDAKQLDGQTEGPLFDGVRLLILNYEEAVVDLTTTGWKVGVSTLSTRISNGSGIFQGIPYPADYETTLFDHVVDTSSSFIGTPEIPMKFTVRNVTEDRRVEVVFVEQDNDQTISRNDQIFILENDASGEPVLTWLILFSGDESSLPPMPGDIFLLKILKPFSNKDVFEFTTVVTGISQDEPNYSILQFRLYQNYPNPFNPTTTIEYSIKSPADVLISIYNILGQKIRTLVDEYVEAGLHRVLWNGKNSLGHQMSSGFYFYRIETMNFTQTKKLVLVR